MSSKQLWDRLFNSAAVVAAAVGLGVMAFSSMTPKSRSANEIVLPTPEAFERPTLLGHEGMGNLGSARVVVVEFSDFFCPSCAAFFREQLPAIRSKYIDTGRAAWYFRHLPLREIHPLAESAAEIAQCASLQGRFWPTHDILFERQETSLDFGSIALDAKLNLVALTRCVGEPSSLVREDIEYARRNNINVTPTFLVGTFTMNRSRLEVLAIISGVPAPGQFERALEDSIRKAEAGPSK